MRYHAAVVACMMSVALLVGGAKAAAAHDCSGQNGVCIAACLQYGIGRRRQQDPHPMPLEFCHRHCAAWYAGCLKSGCWNADLVRVCGLDKK